jgi:hypothetical protein
MHCRSRIMRRHVTYTWNRCTRRNGCLQRPYDMKSTWGAMPAYHYGLCIAVQRGRFWRARLINSDTQGTSWLVSFILHVPETRIPLSMTLVASFLIGSELPQSLESTRPSEPCSACTAHICDVLPLSLDLDSETN